MTPIPVNSELNTKVLLLHSVVTIPLFPFPPSDWDISFGPHLRKGLDNELLTQPHRENYSHLRNYTMTSFVRSSIDVTLELSSIGTCSVKNASFFFCEMFPRNYIIIKDTLFIVSLFCN